MKLLKKVNILDAATLAITMQQARYIDANAVESIDTSILQLLCAMKQAAPTTIIEHPSASFIDAVERCGMESLLFNDLQEAA